MSNVLAMVLAGGEGTRLDPLTRDRAKPSVPFGGKYRIIDLVLSNFINSSIYNIAVVTQFKAESLIDHVEEGWQRTVGSVAGRITINPAQQRVHKDWYLGTADAVHQNFNRIEKVDPDILAVFGGDHIYKMNINDMIVYQQLRGADMTIAAIPVPVEKASRQYGVIVVDEDYNLVGFQEKPEKPEPLPDDPTRCLVSMGNYLFSRDLLTYCFHEDARKEYVSKNKLNSLLEFDPYAQDKYSTHDIGYDIIPFLHRSGLRILVYDFARNQVPGVTGKEKGYWRDVGTLEEFYESNMDICGITPVFNLYNKEWPIRTSTLNFAPAKFSLSSEVYNSVIAEGAIITGARVINSVLGYDVRCEKGSEVEFSVIFNGVKIAPGTRIKGAIIDKYVEVPPGICIGCNPEEDKKRGLIVTPGGITVVPKRHVFK